MTYPSMNENLLFREFNMATVYLATLNMPEKFNMYQKGIKRHNLSFYQTVEILKVTFPELCEQSSEELS